MDITGKMQSSLRNRDNEHSPLTIGNFWIFIGCLHNFPTACPSGSVLHYLGEFSLKMNWAETAIDMILYQRVLWSIFINNLWTDKGQDTIMVSRTHRVR